MPRLMMPKMTKYIPHTPTPKQAAYLLLPHIEAFYGGEPGGGKSDALLMGALQYADTPGYAAILFRRTYQDLALPGALMDRAKDWLSGTDARWNEQKKTWTFPSGATLSFGYLENEDDKFRYQGAEFQYIGLDEASHFSETQYTYLFSRLRRNADSKVPLRMRSASNPPTTPKGQWVKKRFVLHRSPKRPFIPSGLDDNPYIDRTEYQKSLDNLDHITRRSLFDWFASVEGGVFAGEWWANGRNRYRQDDETISKEIVARWLFIDTAFKDKDTSDFSACAVVELWPDYRLGLRYMWSKKILSALLPKEIEGLARTWNHDNKLRQVIIEDKGSGTTSIQTLRMSAPSWLAEMITEFMPTGTKEYRARLASVWCERDCIQFPYPSNDNGEWYTDFLDPDQGELFMFPNAAHDDRTDCLTMSIIYLEHYISEGHRARGGNL
jgi:phage terminase large subunit-like protein